MSLNKILTLSCSLFVLSGLVFNNCELSEGDEIKIPHEVDNYKEKHSNIIKIKTDFKPVEDKYEVNVY